MSKEQQNEKGQGSQDEPLEHQPGHVMALEHYNRLLAEAQAEQK